MEKQTRFTHIARPKIKQSGPVNHPITRASTILLERAQDLYRSDLRTYGRHGTAVHTALSEAFCLLEGGTGASLTPSGLSACTLAILNFVSSGDHILISDSSYGPVRKFTQGFLSRMGVKAEFYDPHIGADIEKLILKNTALIWLESPGSLTFEIQDIPAITTIAKAKNIPTIIDNTWSAGLSLQPLSLGVDVSVQAATKYIGGHSDIMFGAVISKSQAHANRVANTCRSLGLATSSDDAYQMLRGFRTLVHRFDSQAKTAFELAQWLTRQDDVSHVLHPALPTHPNHDIWARDFTGGGCVFGVVLTKRSPKNVENFINALTLFGIGFSYGGFESLAIHCDPQLKRQRDPELSGPLIRFACGLEAVSDLKADIKAAFHKAASS